MFVPVAFESRCSQGKNVINVFAATSSAFILHPTVRHFPRCVPVRHFPRGVPVRNSSDYALMMEERAIFEKVYPEMNATHLHFDVLDSTQLYCRRNMKTFLQSKKLKDDDSMIIVSCNSQTNGIGTRDTKEKVDRKWISERGNIFTTFMLLWSIEELQKVSCLAQTSTVAISKTVETFNLQSQIKWVNDVMVSEKKIAGCLVNMYFLDEYTHLGNKYVCVMVGIGINVHLTGDINILGNNYTSIRKELMLKINVECIVPSVEDVTQKLIVNFYTEIKKLHMEGFSSLLDYITKRLLYKGKKVIINQDSGQITGYLNGIQHDGSLLLLNDNNHVVHVNTGHLSLHRT
ncbi:biotin--acetyl-CoA-carboxylase, putative [Plasmodium ovale wallikeri]|uniref:Biotin--acetyl-CoA-carboxylase, putative n=2 Tax=Plasmodium ovale TaxID=36330 RepID=A0A1A8YMP6_PLAOA|nr:biotin--acetyl-CoA-carboxylase, putative [Plasmodium ovale wallikeri]SBT33300.1 biotin--acetyl-CoA-carboxylase, putative [Plasmodium ovale wallikeri]